MLLVTILVVVIVMTPSPQISLQNSTGSEQVVGKNYSCNLNREWLDKNATNYYWTSIIHSVFSYTPTEAQHILYSSAVFSPTATHLFNQSNPVYLYYFSKKAFFWILLIFLMINIVHYLSLFILSFKQCPPKAWRRDMTTRPWSKLEEESPAKISMFSGGLIIYLGIECLVMITTIQDDYQRVKCAMTALPEQTLQGVNQPANLTLKVPSLYFQGVTNTINNIAVINSLYSQNYQKINDVFQNSNWINDNKQQTIFQLDQFVKKYMTLTIKSPGGSASPISKIQPSCLYKIGPITQKDQFSYNMSMEYSSTLLEQGNRLLLVKASADALYSNYSTYLAQLQAYSQQLSTLSNDLHLLQHNNQQRLFFHLQTFTASIMPLLFIILIILVVVNAPFVYLIYHIFIKQKHKLIQMLNFIWVFSGLLLVPLALMTTFSFMSIIFLQDTCANFSQAMNDQNMMAQFSFLDSQLRFTYSQCYFNQGNYSQLNTIYSTNEQLSHFSFLDSGSIDVETFASQITTSLDKSNLIKDYATNLDNTTKHLEKASNNQDPLTLMNAEHVLWLANSYLLRQSAGELTSSQMKACTGGPISDEMYTLGPRDTCLPNFQYQASLGAMISPTNKNCFLVIECPTAQTELRYNQDGSITKDSYLRNCQGDTYSDSNLSLTGITVIITTYLKGLYEYAVDAQEQYTLMKNDFTLVTNYYNSYNTSLYTLTKDLKTKILDQFKDLFVANKNIYLKTDCSFVKQRILSNYQYLCIDFVGNAYIFLFLMWLIQIFLYIQVIMVFTTYYRIKNLVKPGQSILKQIEKQKRRELKKQQKQELAYKKQYQELQQKLKIAKQDKKQYDIYNKEMNRLKSTLKNSNISRQNLSNILQQEEHEVDRVLKRDKENSIPSSSVGSYDSDYEVQRKDVFSVSSDENNPDALKIQQFKTQFGK